LGDDHSGVLLPNSQNKTYITKEVLDPVDVENILFIGDPMRKGHGDYVVAFYVTASQMSRIEKSENEFEWFSNGPIFIANRILYSGPNVFKTNITTR